MPADERLAYSWKSGYGSGGIATSDQAIVPVLIGALEDEHKGVRYHALEALLEIDTPEAIKAVEEFRKNSEE